MSSDINNQAWGLIRSVIMNRVVMGDVVETSTGQILKISRAYAERLEDAAVNIKPLLLFMYPEDVNRIGHANVLVIQKEVVKKKKKSPSFMEPGGPVGAYGGSADAAESADSGDGDKYIATLYDNHMLNSHTYRIKEIQLVVEASEKSSSLGHMKEYIKSMMYGITAWFTNIFKRDNMTFGNWLKTTTSSQDEIHALRAAAEAKAAEALKADAGMMFWFDVKRTRYTELQKHFPKGGVCLWSAIIIYLELLKKRKDGKRLKLTRLELEEIVKNIKVRRTRDNPLGPQKYFNDFYEYVLKPQIEDIYEKFKGQQSVNVAIVKRTAPNPGVSRGPEGRSRRSKSATPMGGKRKTRRKRKKNKKRVRRTRRRKRNYSRKT